MPSKAGISIKSTLLSHFRGILRPDRRGGGGGEDQVHGSHQHRRSIGTHAGTRLCSDRREYQEAE